MTGPVTLVEEDERDLFLWDSHLWGFLGSGQAGLWEGGSSRPPVTRAHWQGACCVRVPFIQLGPCWSLAPIRSQAEASVPVGLCFLSPRGAWHSKCLRKEDPEPNLGKAVLNSIQRQPALGSCSLWGNPLHLINGSPLIGQNEESGKWRLNVSTLAF